MENKLCVQQLHSPLRQYMPWLTAVIVIATPLNFIATLANGGGRAWWSYALVALSELILAVIVIDFLRSIRKATGHAPISISWYVRTTILAIPLSLPYSFGTSPVLDYIYAMVLLWVLGPAILTNRVLFIIMCCRLRRRFTKPLSCIGTYGLVQECSMWACIIGCMGGILFHSFIVVIVSVLFLALSTVVLKFIFLWAIMRATVPADASEAHDGVAVGSGEPQQDTAPDEDGKA